MIVQYVHFARTQSGTRYAFNFNYNKVTMIIDENSRAVDVKEIIKVYLNSFHVVLF